MIEIFIKYMTIGLVFTLLVELMIDWLIKQKALVKYSKEDWGWSERIICVWIWPVALIVVVDGYIKGYFNKNK